MPDEFAVHADPLPYVDALAARPPDSIDLVVIHCTELPDLATARRFGERIHYEESRTGNSGHYYVDRDGSVHHWVPIDRIAHHTRGYNHRSIGVELVNTGRYPDWLDSRHQAMDVPYTQSQIDALIRLLHGLQSTLPSLQWIAGHEDLDTTEVPASNDATVMVRRKRDPGPLFPWDVVLDAVRLRRFPAG